MSHSSIITDYLGQGVAASRPASLSIAATAVGFYYATDTGALSLWDTATTAWVTLSSGGGGWLLGSATALAGSMSLNSGTLSNEAQGTITLAGTTTGTVSPITGFNSYLVNVGTAAGTISVASGSIHGQEMRLDIKQGPTAHTVAFDATVIPGTDVTGFTASTNAGTIDMVKLIWGGTEWRLSAVARGYAS